MSKYERLSRLMQIVNLIRSHSKTNRPFLAEKLGVGVRTIQRDINSLCYSGVPIFWYDGGYEIVKGYFMPPINLDLDEALHLVLAAREYAEKYGEPRQKPVESAVSKIIARLSDETRNDLEVAMDNADSEKENTLQLLSENNQKGGTA